MPVYLDCNATTPVDPRVAAAVTRFMVEEFGNAGSRTHEFGARAKQAIERARGQVATAVGAAPDEVVFTSGATESNNIALLGLAAFGARSNRRHIISTQIEHKAVLEPLTVLGGRGFEVDLVAPQPDGRVDPNAIRSLLRSDTLLVSVMHANNETGVIQPVEQIAEFLAGHEAYFHVDAAQTLGKLSRPLRNRRIDLTSLSAHKVFAPKGVGALVARRRAFEGPPLTPLMFGGGQERGLRPGTLPVALIVGFGLAVELAEREAITRVEACRRYRERLLEAFAPLDLAINGDPPQTLPHTLNLSIAGVDSEAAMVALKGLVAIANGSACTSATYGPSHVLRAMGLPADRIRTALRFSWSHATEDADWVAVRQRLVSLRS